MSTTGTTLVEQLQPLRGGAAYFRGALGEGHPRIEVQELGPLSFPLNRIQVAALLERAMVAPFGKGRETLVDKTVRNTREIDADQLKSDWKWSKRLDALLDQAAKEMAIPGGIRAVPYKLLIYSPGGFFAEHQDSEKLPGMFGTLLVGLPSAHEGGAIRIDPGEGEPIVVDFAENDAVDFPAVAFLADRKHEILPVTSGYRVVLVYNLVYASGQAPDRVDVEAVARELADTLGETRVSDEPLVLALDHQYTETNFSTTHLKGNDRVRVAALRRAAGLAGIEIRVGLIEERVSAEWLNGDAYGQGYGGGYYRRRYQDSYERDPETFGEIEIGDPLVEELYMNDWLEEDGPELGSLKLRESEILAGPGYRQDEPIEWSVEGYQGNWGMTADYVYRHAGVVLWHPAATPRLLERLPLDGRISWILTWCRELAAAPEDDRLRKRAEALLATVAQALTGTYTVPADTPVIAEILTVLGQHGSQPAELFDRWQPILERLFASVPPKRWKALVSVFGANALDRLFRDVGLKEPGWNTEGAMTRLNGLIEVIRTLSGDQDEQRKLAQQQLARLPDYLQAQSPQGKLTPTLVAALLDLVQHTAPDEQWVRRVGDHLLRRVDDPDYRHGTLGAELRMSRGHNPLYDYLYRHTVGHLGERLLAEPQPFTDWTRPLPRDAEKAHARYRKLLTFLADPDTETFRFQAPQGERNELAGYLTRNELDVDQRTERTRPAHTLVLTKNDASYHRTVKQLAKDKKLLARLEALPSSTPSDNPQLTFVRRLARTALQDGYRPEDVQRALLLYSEYFADLVAGRSPRAQEMSIGVDELLDLWEEQLDERYRAGKDEGHVPGVYASLDELSREAFAAVAGEVG